MSDPKRATLITVGAPKSAKNNVIKTVRLSINLEESNESKYPELNYKELVIEQERKPSPVENGKKPGLDPFSDNDDDVERVARKFEQKYGGKSTYGRKSKRDDYADIGAGYDRNDSFIDDTDGYDEYIPPGCDTRYGGFYINSGSLEFKSVPPPPPPDADGARRNKRRISSSSSEEESSGSSSGSDSQPAKEAKPVVNGVHSLDAEHRKKKIKNMNKKAKRVKRNDSAAAASGKQTSDDTGPNEAESGDTASSHSAESAPRPPRLPSHTSDSSRDAEPKPELPKLVRDVLTELVAHLARAQLPVSLAAAEDRGAAFLIRLETAISACEARAQKTARAAAARALGCTRAELTARARRLQGSQPREPSVPATGGRRGSVAPQEDFAALTAARREEIIVDALAKLEALIEERKPAMIANYNAECSRVQEERKKLQSTTDGCTRPPERRLPKRRFPWCGRARALLGRVAAAAGSAAPHVLRSRALPLFPKGFVRMPTLLRQANLKQTEQPRAPAAAAAAAAAAPAPLVAPLVAPPAAPLDQIHFPASLTVTATTKPPEYEDKRTTKPETTTFGKILSSLSNKDDDEKAYVPNNIGSITITAVQNKPEKRPPAPTLEKHKETSPLIRVKSPAALMKDMTDSAKKEKQTIKKVERKPVDTPLHVDTTGGADRPTNPSPKEPGRLSEDKLPRPALIPKHHSPNFVKPEKRPPEAKKKKEVLIVSDVDPLAMNHPDLVTIDESSSDVELVEDRNSDSDKVISVSDTVEQRDKSAPSGGGKEPRKHKDVDDSEVDIDAVMKNLREMQDSQEPSFTSNSFSGVIANAKSTSSFREQRERDKFADLSSLSKMDGCSAVTG